MSSPEPKMGAAIDGGLGDEVFNSEENKATKTDQRHIILEAHSEVTPSIKENTLQEQFAALQDQYAVLQDQNAALQDKVTSLSSTVTTATKLLNGFQPDILSQALKIVKDPTREFEVFTTGTLAKAYERVSNSSDEDISEDEGHEASITAETPNEPRVPPAQPQTQDPFLQSIISGEYQAQVQAREDAARQAYQTEQAVETVPEGSKPSIGSRPKYTPKYSTWCEKETAVKAQSHSQNPCSRTKCPFLHNDQNEYMLSGQYEKDKNARLVQDWDLKPYNARTGHNLRNEKASKKEQNLDNVIKNLRKKKVATEAKANAEYAQKMKKAAIEAQAVQKSDKAAMKANATSKALPKKRKVASTPASDANAENSAKRMKDGETKR